MSFRPRARLFRKLKEGHLIGYAVHSILEVMAEMTSVNPAFLKETRK
jgi:hypothetical protein